MTYASISVQANKQMQRERWKKRERGKKRIAKELDYKKSLRKG